MDNPRHRSTPEIGTRIRDARLERRIRQAELAAQVQISPSYLNLIEHNRRRIGTELLERIAEALGTEASDLSAEVDQTVVDDLLSAAGNVAAAPEVDRVGELALRFPGWASLITAQSKRIVSLEARVQEVTDRMAHDPALATSLHEVISTATSIRSTASILNGEEVLDADWQRRFHQNIHADAIRLAESSDALMSYLEAPEEGESTQSPLVGAEVFLADRGFHLPELETGRLTVEDYLDAHDLSPAVLTVLAPRLRTYAEDAGALPMAEFENAARACRYDPAELSMRFSCQMQRIMRRLASLPPASGHPPLGLIQTDASGFVGLCKELPGIAFPRTGACPLWPIFAAAGQPGRPIRSMVALPGVQERRVLCYALAEQRVPTLGEAPRVEALMLLQPDPPQEAGPLQKLGSNCRICPRSNCDARREPSVTGNL